MTFNRMVVAAAAATALAGATAGQASAMALPACAAKLAAPATGPTASCVFLESSSYADGGSHTIQFQYDYPGGGTFDGNIFIDDVSIDATNAPARRAFGRHVDKAVAAKQRKHAKR